MAVVECCGRAITTLELLKSRQRLWKELRKKSLGKEWKHETSLLPAL